MDLPCFRDWFLPYPAYKSNLTSLFSEWKAVADREKCYVYDDTCHVQGVAGRVSCRCRTRWRVPHSTSRRGRRRMGTRARMRWRTTCPGDPPVKRLRTLACLVSHSYVQISHEYLCSLSTSFYLICTSVENSVTVSDFDIYI